MSRSSLARAALAGAISLTWTASPIHAAGAPDSPSQDAYVLIGVDPDTVRIDIEEATIQDGAVTGFEHWFPPHLYGPGDDGFILAKVKAGTELAIRATNLSPIGLLPGPRFKPCNRTLAFQTQAGAVVYLFSVAYDYGSVGFRLGHESINVHTTYSQDFEGARAFLKRNHPELAGELQQGQSLSVSLPRALSCQSPAF